MNKCNKILIFEDKSRGGLKLMKVIVNLMFLCVVIISFCNCGDRDKVKTIPIQDFFVKPERTSFKVSPDGRRIAYIGVEDHCRNIFILDTEIPDSSKQLTYEKHINVQYFFWATSDSIVYSNSHSNKDSLRLFIIDIHTEKSTYLIPPAQHELRWVSPTHAIDGKILAQLNVRDSTIFDLYRIPLNGKGPELVELNTQRMGTWVASMDGQVRLAISSDSIQDKIWYRDNEGEPFRNVLNTDFISTIIPLGPAKGSNSSFYGLSNIGKDKSGLVLMDFKTGDQQVLVDNEKADLNKEGYLFSKGEMIYTSVSTEDRKEINVLNDKLKSIYQEIQRKYADYNIDLIDVDENFNLVVFKIYTDVDPGQVLYYSAKSGEIKELVAINPSLKNIELSPMQAVSYFSRDGKLINGFLTYPLIKKDKYPVVVLVHDGPNSRDNWGFNQEVQFLANRGYAVFQVNYRGSTGFGKEFVKEGYKQWGGEIQNDISDGVSWLIHQGIADKDRVAIMGTGFGGYSALYAACFNPTLYKCAISSSGYTNLFTYLKEIPPFYQQYLQMYYKIIGDPSKESDLFKAISPLFHAEKIKMPILMFQGGRDRYNSITDINQFVQKVKNNGGNIKYTFFEEEGRRIRKEENIILYYQQVEDFLSRNL